MNAYFTAYVSIVFIALVIGATLGGVFLRVAQSLGAL